MDEEPNENELEERLYAMLHHVDETQPDVNTAIQNDSANILDNAPRSTIRRYWRTSGDQPSSYQKVNTPKDNAPPPHHRNQSTTATISKNVTTNSSNINGANKDNVPAATVRNQTTFLKTTATIKPNNQTTIPKEEKSPEPNVDLSLFQTSPRIVNKTIEIIEDFLPRNVILESSDEDEVIEVALPPKPTITIESSDEDELHIVTKDDNPSKNLVSLDSVQVNVSALSAEREISTSPVPSVVSSVSDDFIRGDCIALNISSKRPDNHSFDFSLHGADLLGNATPSKKKKKKKSKEVVTSTPVKEPDASLKSGTPNAEAETCFATPKSKAKNKKKNKSYTVTERSVPSADVYDSDSNQSVIDTNKDQNTYKVTDKSLPSTDVYESDISLPEKEVLQPINTVTEKAMLETVNENFVDLTKSSRHDTTISNDSAIVDLTESESYITLDCTDISESIVMANVTGFKESEDYGDEPYAVGDVPSLGSTKVPQILFDNLDFDNLKGKDAVCKRRKYSLTTLRAEMEKFYNESWGGEDFNHREIQKYMSRDKSLWMIDPKDRMPALSKRKVTCNYCNRAGHRDDTCRMKPPVCYMCGNTGHFEPRCPRKICVNCGSPNHLYSTMCRNCSYWERITCAECGQRGHPATHCPDLWRRYHNTIDSDTPLSENRFTKKNHQLYCSGCTRRGHLVHSCRVSLPFSGLAINSPYVALYRPLYMPSLNDDFKRNRNFQDSTVSSASPFNVHKRRSKSPAIHENHHNKKRTLSAPETEADKKIAEVRQRKNSTGKTQADDGGKDKTTPEAHKNQRPAVGEMLDFIPISSSNRDNRGHMIQDNEVSDTSNAVTSARIYVTKEVIDKLKTEEGVAWLKDQTNKQNVEVNHTQNSELMTYLDIKGKYADQEVFQAELREWTRTDPSDGNANSNNRDDDERQVSENREMTSNQIPKNRGTLLKVLNAALNSLNQNFGDPKAIYKQLHYLENKHARLLKQKVFSPKKMSNVRAHMNTMFKNLNIILLGQAGLAEGTKHVRKLNNFQKKLGFLKGDIIPQNMRKDIGEHYHKIFSAIPRNDYVELMDLYYVGKTIPRGNQIQIMDKSKNTFKQSKVPRLFGPTAAPQLKQTPTVTQMVMPNEKENQNIFDAGGGDKNQICAPAKRAQPILMGKLRFYYTRIKNSCPTDGVLKKTKTELARKLHSMIASRQINDGVLSSKTTKKVKKILKQAETFLCNV